MIHNRKAIYQDKEYSVETVKSESVILTDADGSKIEVKHNQITNVYYDEVFGIYRGLNVRVMEAEHGVLIIQGSYQENRFLEEGFSHTGDPGIYEKVIDAKDLEKRWNERTHMKL